MSVVNAAIQRQNGRDDVRSVVNGILLLNRS